MADFVLGRLKFNWRADWATSTAYIKDDIVKYGANTYTCLINHTSAAVTADFYTDLNTNSYWSLHTEGLAFKGDWAGSTFYKLNDLVKYGAFQYRCILQHTSASDFAIGSNWVVYSEGLQFEDSYNAGTTYQDGDVVTYGGYSYVYVNSTPSAGNTPTDDSYWDVITTGFNATGNWSSGTAYKTGDTVQFGGNSYVAEANHTGQNPANSDGSTNTAYWQLVNEGLSWQGAYSSITTYYINHIVEYTSTSYVAVASGFSNVTPGTDATKWAVLAEGDQGAVMTTRGDMIRRNSSGIAARLAIGSVGSVLTTDGNDPIWSNAEGANVKYVANSGSDSNPGTQFQPYKTIKYALSQATSGDVVEVESIAGGTGGTPGTYDATQTGTSGSGTGMQIRVVLDGSSVPTSVVITNGGSGHAAGDTITFADTSSQIGGATSITMDVVSASIGDVVYVKNGVFREQLPLIVPAGVTVQGESLRGTEVRPASGTGSQIATVSITSNTSGASDATYNYIHQSASSGDGTGAVFNITVSSGVVSAVTVYHGGVDYAVADTITIPSANIGSGGDLTLAVASLENNNASNMWLVNNTTNIVQMAFKGLTGTPTAGGTTKAAVVSLDPSGSISTTSPYIQNCSSVSANATGVQIDGNLHSAGNKSILCNDFTQINSDGRGVHAIAGGRGEMVSVFTYYCDKSFFAESGGFIRALNCSSAYGEIGAEATGTLASETPVSVISRGQILKYDSTTFAGAATESDIADMIATSGVGTATIVGNTSGATATIFRVNISLDYLHIESITGTFTNGETVTITKENSSTFQVNLAGSSAQTGQVGPLIAVDSSDGTLGSANVITVGANVQFAGDSTYYRVSAVSETNTSNQQALIRLTASVSSGNAIADNTATTVSTGFSNVRLTGHDFLDIGTGDFATTNYPGGPSQAPDQSDEVNELNGGRVYFSSTDQKGDFRIGDLFKIEQATGVATLNADAFDLSGLNELQLGSIGAELGATINEFSTDETLSNDSNTAVSTERAIVGYTQRDKMGTGHFVPPTGTTAERPTGGTLFEGGIRYNSTLSSWEGYNGSDWTGLGGGNPWTAKTGTYTAVNNDRLLVDTSGGTVTITLPASPSAGDTVRFLDQKGSFNSNNLTIGRNSSNIQGSAADLTVATQYAGFALVYSGDATAGWLLQDK